MRYTIATIVLVSAMTLSVAGMAQNVDDKKTNSEIKINNLDVIYEDEEYKGIVIDRKDDRETEDNIYRGLIINANNDDDDDEDGYVLMPPMTFSDEGASSENDILNEGFDTAIIHLPSFDVNSITDPINIELRNEARGEKFTWPTPLTSRPSSHFGPRRRRFHYGLDLALPTGEPIYAAFDGVVRISKWNKSYGNLVILHHANGLETYYAHMSKRHVVAGQHVKSGDVIGLCGNTGRSFGSHLHFEVRYHGCAMNPEDVVDCATHDLVSDHLTITPASFRKVAKPRNGNANTIGSDNNSGNGRRATASGNNWYRVRQGDTLEKIARRHGTTVKRLCQLNGISANKVLHPGDRIKVSGSTSSRNSSNVGSDNSSAAQSATQGQQSQGTGATYYTVRSGDTLSKIAKRNGTTVKKICQLNGISETSTLRIGQKLRVK